MSEPQQEPPQQIRRFVLILWLYAGWNTLTGVVIVVGATLPTIVLGWDMMLPSGKAVAIIGVTVAAWKAVDLEFRRIIRRVMEGKPPVEIPKNGNGGSSNGGSGDTQHFPKTAGTVK